MSALKRIARVVATATALGIAAGASAHGLTNTPTTTMSFEQMQSLSSEGPTWHANDGSIYDPNRSFAMTGRTASPLFSGHMPSAPDYAPAPGEASDRG
jgi:hypothetical protein